MYMMWITKQKNEQNAQLCVEPDIPLRINKETPLVQVYCQNNNGPQYQLRRVDMFLHNYGN